MGIKLVWTKPDSESTFDKVYIYRADSQNGTYTEIASQDINDNTYYDMSGNTSNWYKIRFYDSINDIWSEYSDPIQGGFYGAYCTLDDVKSLAEIPSDIDDETLFKLSRVASLQINHDIQTKIYKERVKLIDNIKTNIIDGSNKTFYTKNFPIGDMNNDFQVTTEDITVYKVYDDEETEMTVSSIDALTGKFVLENAPENGSVLYVTYCYTPRHYPVDPVNDLIRQATAYLTAFIAKSKVGDVSVTRYTIDRLTVMNIPDQVISDYKNYLDLIDRIRADSSMVVGPLV